MFFLFDLKTCHKRIISQCPIVDGFLVHIQEYEHNWCIYQSLGGSVEDNRQHNKRNGRQN